MQDFYKNEYEKTDNLLKEKESELGFYKSLVFFINGMTSVIVIILFGICSGIFGIFLANHWSTLSIEAVIGMAALIITIIGIIIKYYNLIFNWPEELLRKNKERRK